MSGSDHRSEPAALPVGFQSFHRRAFINYQLNRAHALGHARADDLRATASVVRTRDDCLTAFDRLSAEAAEAGRYRPEWAFTGCAGGGRPKPFSDRPRLPADSRTDPSRPGRLRSRSADLRGGSGDIGRYSGPLIGARSYGGDFVRVTFFKLVERRCSYWEAVRGERTVVPGTPMALGRGGMPHDLLQMLVEGSVGIDDSFWGSVTAGATFKSTGRKRSKPGRAVIAPNRSGNDRAERVVADHLRRGAAGEPTPCAEVLMVFTKRWDNLGIAEGLVIDWPSLDFIARVRSPGSPAH